MRNSLRRRGGCEGVRLVAALRFARNCLDAEAVVPARCPCCTGIKLMLLDNQDRIRAVASVSIEELRSVLADAEAGKLPPFDIRQSPIAHGTSH